MSPAALTLTASIFLVGACNGAFWRSFIGATGNLSLAHQPLIAGSFVLIVMLFNACLTLVSFRPVLKPVLMVLFVATALTSYFMNQYGTQIDRLPEIIRAADRDMVIVLHQKGSHGPAYWKRYPAAFKYFAPVCETVELEQCSREAIVAAYDNTILYTDHFLNRAIELLKTSAASEHVDTAILYFSDHGESLGEHNMYLHGAPYMISPAEQREVPMMLWMSEGCQARFQINQRCVAARAAQRFSHDNVFHSVLGMLDVSTSVYNPRLDIFGPCTHDA